jgi:hypothetical protein
MEGRILPPLPGLAVPGNLLWLINRSGKDTRTLITNDEISPIMTATSDPLWLLRASSALSAKRLVDALNLAHAREFRETTDVAPHSKGNTLFWNHNREERI